MGNKLFIGNLPFKMNRQKLKDLFINYGEMTEVLLIRERKTGKSKGFRFVSFVEESSISKALAEMNHKIIEGREIKLNEAFPIKEESLSTLKLKNE